MLKMDADYGTGLMRPENLIGYDVSGSGRQGFLTGLEHRE